jgi:fumarylpyruvate hydrolase
MIWSVPEQIAYLSEYYTLEPGDVIFTGTPAGVGPVKPGDELLAGIDGVGELKVRIVAAL